MELNPTQTTYSNLLLAYRFMNDRLFDGILPPCLITLQREKRTYGYFCRNRFVHRNNDSRSIDEIALNPQYFRSLGRDDKSVIATLVHEMCHMWQHHYGKPGRSRYHNKEWALQMKSIGLLPTDTGTQDGKGTGDCVTHLIIKTGRYELAYEELKSKGFVLEWIESTSLFEEQEDLPAAVENENSDEDTYPAGSAVVLPSLSPVSPFRSFKKDTSKMKFSCPECGQNAWAKIGANLVCGICEVRMGCGNG